MDVPPPSEDELHDEQASFLLLPGAGLRNWIWREVTPRLSHPSLAIDFPRTSGAHLGDYVQHVVDQVESWDAAQRIVVVAHSLGGVIGLEVASQLGDRLAGFAAVSAVLPVTGKSFAGALPIPERLVMPVILRLFGTRPPDSAIRHGYCQDLPTEVADEVVARFAAESRRVYLDKHHATLPESVTSRYLVLTDDTQFSQVQQRKFAADAGIRDCVDVSGGHLAMLSNPDGVAGALNDLTSAVRS